MSGCRGIGHAYGCACCAPWLWKLAGPKHGLASRRSVLAAALGGSALALGGAGVAAAGERALRRAPEPLSASALLALATANGGADRIWRNGRVATMDGETADRTALAVSNGRVVAVGSDDEIGGLAGSRTQVIDLDGRTVLPGLVDGHGHLANTALCLGFADLQPAPAGPVGSIGELQQALREHRDRHGLYEGWLIGRGYDESLIAEHRHPTRDDLDQVAADIPIFC